jgi:DNA-directed RNA polymerase sigma subunit (sigma70/sigma32)
MDPDYSCALDIAERGPMTLEDVAAATRLTRERVRQLEHRSMKKLKLLGNLMVMEPERRSEED